MGTDGHLYGAVADLPVRVESVALTGRSTATSYGFRRPTTVVHLRGAGHEGRGEDVTTNQPDHERFQSRGVGADLTGSYTLATFSERVGALDLAGEDWTGDGAARRWALESAALDLGLRQAGASLGERVGRSYDPVRFVASLRLSAPPSVEPLREWRALVPDLEFKLDVPPDWDRSVVERVAAVDGVRVLDFKAVGEDPDDDRVTTDPELYETVLGAFPAAVVEDPLWRSPFRELLADRRDTVSWDAAIDGVSAVERLPFEPEWLNVKPARFGTVESLFETVTYALDRGITLYGGGMFEQDRGRAHLHALAALFYPDGPNDVAPPVYNEPTPRADTPRSPLSPPDSPVGIGF